MCLFGICIATGQPSEATHSVYVVGNLSDIRDKIAYAEDFGTLLKSVDHRKSLILAGDLVNPHRDLQEELDKLKAFLLAIPKEKCKIVVLPGDRDWADSGPEGVDMQKRIEELVKGLGQDHIIWAIEDGCPGPGRISLDFTLTLIALNTQWWNHPYAKPTPESAECDIASSESAMEELEDLLEDQSFGNVLIAGHFPVFSNGRYGGRFPVDEWIFPIPVVSTMRTAYRQNVGNAVDIGNKRYTELREALSDLFLDHTGLIYVSGHEHDRELLNGAGNYFINSGLPVGDGFVKAAPGQEFASDKAGLMGLHYEADGTVWCSALGYRDRQFIEEQVVKVYQAPCLTPVRGVPVNERLVPCLDAKFVLPEMQYEYPGLTGKVANPRYEAGGFKRMMLGQHYRESWTTRVDVPYMNLDTIKGGLIPFQIGGGRQTKSLKLRGDGGYEYVFRSVDKDPSRALSYDLRETLIALAVQDQTTTQQPYGALAVSTLLDTLEILHAHPELYVLPDDPKLGPFQESFGGLLGMLEDRPTGKKQLQRTFADADQIKRTKSMFRSLYKDRDNTVADTEFVRARVFDILVGDWGKHEDNWKWAGFDGEKGTYYRPIPRDRDHVFSLWDGFLPWLADRKWAKPSGEHFGYRINDLRSLMWQARHLDRLVASQNSREDWLNAADYIRDRLTDAKIDEAVHHMPDEILDPDGIEIANKLRQRRDDLKLYSLEYYRMLAKEVDVVGSVKQELFEVTYRENGEVDVEMYKIRKGEKDKLFYSRRFYPKETREIRLFGLRGEDVFHLSGQAARPPLVRIIPGPGEDRIEDESHVNGARRNNRLYALGDGDEILAGDELRQMEIPYEEAYNYRRTAFAYNTYMPLFVMYYSSENGFMAGLGVRFVRQRYGKPDFSSTHSFLVRASTIGNVRFTYGVHLRHVVGAWDVVGDVLLDKRSNFNYFFGLGNETNYDPAFLNADYYTLRYSQIGAGVGLRREFWNASHVQWGISLRNYSRETQENNIIEEGTGVPGSERELIMKAHFEVDFDFRDNPNLPTRGMRMFSQAFVAKSVNTELDHYGRAHIELEFLNTMRPFTLGLRGGYAYHFDTAPYYDLFYLGQNQYLRGYLQNRFAGDQLVFFNGDLRFQLFHKTQSLLPFKFGINLFCDTGRAFLKGETSNTWHVGYGAGLYFVPLRDRFVITLSAGFSEEESGLIQFGFGKAF